MLRSDQPCKTSLHDRASKGRGKRTIECALLHVNNLNLSCDNCYNQFGSMPVLEEAKTMVYVTNHNMITMAMVIFKTYKMADKGEERKEY